MDAKLIWKINNVRATIPFIWTIASRRSGFIGGVCKSMESALVIGRLLKLICDNGKDHSYIMCFAICREWHMSHRHKYVISSKNEHVFYQLICLWNVVSPSMRKFMIFCSLFGVQVIMRL